MQLGGNGLTFGRRVVGLLVVPLAALVVASLGTPLSASGPVSSAASVGERRLVERSIAADLADETLEAHFPAVPTNKAAENVLLIMVDDLRIFDGAIGHPQALTPAIDRLQAGGMTFANATSDSMICGPSRSSFALGLRPTSTGLVSHHEAHIDFRGDTGYFTFEDSVAQANYGRSVRSIKTVFELYSDAGFSVGYAGKVMHSDVQGDYENSLGSIDTYLPAHFNLAESYKDEDNPDNDGYPVHGYEDVVRNKPNADWGNTEDVVPPPGVDPYTEADTTNFLVKESAVSMLRQTGDEPFFIAAGFTQPHLPLYIPERFVDMYDDIGTITTPAVIEDDLFDLALPRTKKKHMQKVLFDRPARVQDLYKHYLAAVTQVDEYIGEILDELDANGLASSTNVVLWSDHGYHLGEKQKLGKSLPYDVTTNVPLVIRAPGVTTAGSSTDAYVNSVDILPTLLELSLLDPPGDFQRDGRSLVRLLLDPQALWPYSATATFAGVGQRYPITVVFDHRDLSYLEYEFNPALPRSKRLREFYDLAADPDQFHNRLSPYKKQYRRWAEVLSVDLRRQLIGQSLPQQAPSARSTQVVGQVDGHIEIVLEAEDPNVDYLMFSIDIAPANGRLHLVDANGQPGAPIADHELIDARTTGSLTVAYIPDDAVPNGASMTDYFRFAVSDGIALSTGDVFITTPDAPLLTADG